MREITKIPSETRQPADLLIEENERFLLEHQADLQANIFAPHRRNHMLLLFLQVVRSSGQEYDHLIAFLQSLANNSSGRKGIYLTSHQNQTEKVPASRNDLFCNLYLTGEGLQLLKGNDQEGSWKTTWEALNREGNTADLKQVGSGEGDSDQEFYRQPVHAVLLLAHNSYDALLQAEEKVEMYTSASGVRICFTERGRVYRRKFFEGQNNGFAVEHFGYADGISNPWITAEDSLVKGKPKAPAHWNPACSVFDFIKEEPTAAQPGTYGSFVVYRKLQQHVDHFTKAVAAYAARIPGKSLKLAGAEAFGRFQNGLPLELHDDDQANEAFPELNDFQFGKPGGCPMFAHIRKVNPREREVEGLKTLENPILRRGMTYGTRQVDIYGRFSPTDVPDSSDPKKSVGVLFLSFQENIATFQKLLAQAQERPGADPILSSLSSPGQDSRPARSGNEPADTPAEFTQLVSLKGGLNLYAPSLWFFKSLNRSDMDLSLTVEVGESPRNKSLTMETLTSSQTMENRSVNYPLFGSDRYSFLEVVNHYNCVKVGYDGSIAKYGRDEITYSVMEPDTRRGTVPVRDMRRWSDIMSTFQTAEEEEKMPLGFEFAVPVSNKFKIDINAWLTPWNNSQEILAEGFARNYDDIDPEAGAGTGSNGEEKRKTSMLPPLGNKAEEKYDFLRVILISKTDQFLQKKIQSYLSRSSRDYTNRLFVLRVQLIAFPASNRKPGKSFECREDTIILELM